MVITPTWDNVCTVIRDGDDDLYSIADTLGQDRCDLGDQLQEMVDKGLLYRWLDGDVTRYGVCRETRRQAA